ncbi:MAG: hypothetical protein V9E81_07800 [Marmoricola sp.]
MLRFATLAEPNNIYAPIAEQVDEVVKGNITASEMIDAFVERAQEPERD